MSRSSRLGAALREGAVAAGAARLAYAVLAAHPPGGSRTWTRANHAGEPVTLLEGPAVALGAVAGAVAATDLDTRHRMAMILAGAGAAALGGYDDLAGDGASRGFRGHIGALRQGKVTTGAVKLAGIGATGLVAATLARAGRGQPAVTVADCLIDAGLVAGGANLINLFDLRPGRAVKVVLIAGGPLGCSAAAPVAAAASLLPEDLAGRAMLGDAGANAIGAMLGVAATRLPRGARLGALAVIVSLTAASEAVSFTKVIERTPALRWLDRLGRRPAAAAGHPAGQEPGATEPPGSAAGQQAAMAGPAPQ